MFYVTRYFLFAVCFDFVIHPLSQMNFKARDIRRSSVGLPYAHWTLENRKFILTVIVRLANSFSQNISIWLTKLNLNVFHHQVITYSESYYIIFITLQMITIVKTVMST